MCRTAILSGALIAVAGLSPASAQSWSVGVGFGYGEPGYYGPPPVYVYEEPPLVYAPAPPPMVHSAVSPDAVFDALERAGYREFSPMAFRDGVYKLNAVNRRGDLVALEVSALTGAVEREFIIGARQAVRVPAPVPVAPPAASQAPSKPQRDPLVVY
jgi:hypothetical protein